MSVHSARYESNSCNFFSFYIFLFSQDSGHFILVSYFYIDTGSTSHFIFFHQIYIFFNCFLVSRVFCQTLRLIFHFSLSWKRIHGRLIYIADVFLIVTLFIIFFFVLSIYKMCVYISKMSDKNWAENKYEILTILRYFHIFYLQLGLNIFFN